MAAWLREFHENKSFIKFYQSDVESILKKGILSINTRLYWFYVSLHVARNKSMSKDIAIMKPAQEWSKLTGIATSEIYKAQKLLEKQGYIDITRSKDLSGLHQPNVIKANETETDGWQVSFNMKLVELLFQEKSLTAAEKLTWIFLYIKHYNYSCGKADLNSAPITLSELAQALQVSEVTASSALKKLQQLNYASFNQVKVRSEHSTRRAKGVYKVTVIFPEEKMAILEQQPNRRAIDSVKIEEANLQVTKTENFKSKISEYDSKFSVYETKNPNNINNKTYNTKTNNNNLEGSLVTTGNTAENSLSFDEDYTIAEFENCIAKVLPICNGDVFAAKRLVLPKFSKEQQVFIDNHLASKAKAKPVAKAPIAQVVEEKPAIADRISLEDKAIIETSLMSRVKNLQALSAAKRAKIKSYAKAIVNNKIAQGYAKNLSAERLAEEISYHAANWQPSKIAASNADESFNRVLSIAWSKIAKGSWQCPHGLANTEILAREHEAMRDKYYSGYLPATWAEHKQKVQAIL